MQNMNLPKDVIIQALSLDEENYLTFSNLIHSHENFTLDELVDEYFNSINAADKELVDEYFNSTNAVAENESDLENDII